MRYAHPTAVYAYRLIVHMLPSIANRSMHNRLAGLSKYTANTCDKRARCTDVYMLLR